MQHSRSLLFQKHSMAVSQSSSSFDIEILRGEISKMILRVVWCVNVRACESRRVAVTSNEIVLDDYASTPRNNHSS